MAILFLASTAGSPGVTTAAVALTVNWAKPVILVEADSSKTSSIIPGALRGQVYHTTGLTEAAVADQHGALTAEKLWDQTVEIADDKVLIPGFKTLQGAAGATPHFWRSLLDALRLYENSGYDIIVDAGRLQSVDPRNALIRDADSVTLFADTTLPSISSVLPHWQTRDENRRLVPEWLLTTLTEVGHADYANLILSERPTAQETWSPQEVAKVTGLNLLGTIPWDPKGAAVYSLGASPHRGQRTPYTRAISGILQHYAEELRSRAFTPTTWEGQQ